MKPKTQLKFHLSVPIAGFSPRLRATTCNLGNNSHRVAMHSSSKSSALAKFNDNAMQCFANGSHVLIANSNCFLDVQPGTPSSSNPTRVALERLESFLLDNRRLVCARPSIGTVTGDVSNCEPRWQKNCPSPLRDACWCLFKSSSDLNQTPQATRLSNLFL